MSHSLDLLLDAALARRAPLLADNRTDALRLVHGDADGLPGLVIERYGDVLVAQLHEGRLAVGEDTLRPAIENLRRRLGLRAVYKKSFVRDRGHVAPDLTEVHADPTPWLGDPVEPQVTVRENGLRFVVRPYEGFAVGLFLEHRENRRRVRELAAGRRVLNCFSYTGGFSVAAAAGGAVVVHSVDLSRRYLEWCKANFATNGIDPADHLFFRSDVFEFYKRATRQKRRYDLIILDPPTFSRLRRPDRTFILADELERLVGGGVTLLDPGGMLLLAANDRRLAMTRLEEAVAAGAHPRESSIIERPSLPVDFPGDPHYSKTVIARID
ncbi:MAG TPA: class I SAM-dependent methyltransferase [Phycisphaerae bacterium]|nr:class I SAM-dependent methyltransferase [Phycisphaerae bacterium]HRY71107.1 class I SAM-dependent methyltransferase [Phycisphaerae bacterium]HSA29483.1 class I SAM-dependent methyltransferase [Phycisphaerae bacterium]